MAMDGQRRRLIRGTQFSRRDRNVELILNTELILNVDSRSKGCLKIVTDVAILAQP